MTSVSSFLEDECKNHKNSSLYCTMVHWNKNFFRKYIWYWKIKNIINHFKLKLETFWVPSSVVWAPGMETGGILIVINVPLVSFFGANTTLVCCMQLKRSELKLCLLKNSRCNFLPVQILSKCTFVHCTTRLVANLAHSVGSKVV